MNQPDRSCHLCDGTSYYLDSGYYYCTECNTRSEGVQEAAFEEIDPAFHGKTHTVRLKKKRRLDDDERDETNSWTSWEGHNYVLVGLVDELIALGADASIKPVVLQLWAKYLNLLEAAFISTSDKELPKFGLNQCEKDFEIIYGIKKRKRPYLRKRVLKRNFKLKKTVAHAIGTEAEEFEKVRLFRRMRRVVVKTHYEELRKKNLSLPNTMRRLDDRLNETVEEIPEPEPPKVVEYNSEAQRVLGKRIDSRKRRGLEVDDRLQSPESSSRLYFFNTHHLTRCKLLGLILLALRICKQQIQISDILRWVSEGHLSYTTVTHLFPQHLRFSIGDRMFLIPSPDCPTYNAMLKIMLNIARNMSIEALPRADTMSLVRRYLTELALPDELADNVERLEVTIGRPPPSIRNRLENQEALAMAHIIVTLKMLLAIDGITEHRISDVAKAINGLPARTGAPLFVWDDWVRFVECRKATISHEHFASRKRLQGEAAVNVGPYLSYLEKVFEKTEGLEDRVRFTSKHARNHHMKTKIDMCAAEMPDFATSGEASLDFAPSLTPLTTYLETIERAGRVRADILKTDFRQTSVDYLLQPKETLRFAKRQGLRVKFCHGTALKSYLVIPPVRCNMGGGQKIVTISLKDYGDEDEPEEDSEALLATATADMEEPLVLFIPHKHYWLLECEDHTESLFHDFETKVFARLSDSYQWLLAECSAMIGMTKKELYSQIVSVENLLGNHAGT